MWIKRHRGAVRVAGSFNFKTKYAPEFPTVTITHVAPGRVMTEESLQNMGLLAEPEPVRIAAAPRRVSEFVNNRPWPSYDICLMRARKKKDGSPDRSHADISLAMIAITGGHSIEDTAAKLEEVSEKARKNVARGDAGYPMVTATNAAQYVANNKSRSRA